MTTRAPAVLKIESRPTDALALNPKNINYSLTHPLTTWNQKMLAHLKNRKRWFLVEQWAPPDTLPASMASLLLAGSGFSAPRCSHCGVSPTSSFPPVFPACPVLPTKHLAQPGDCARLYRGYWLSRLDVQSLRGQLAGNLNTLLAALSSVASVAALSTNQLLWEHAVCLKHVWEHAVRQTWG